MSKGLDLIQRQQLEVIDGYPTGNVYVGLSSEELAEREKKLEAFDIANEKNVNVGMLKRSETVSSYNYKMDELRDKCKPLTQDEFDLLKEALR